MKSRGGDADIGGVERGIRGTTGTVDGWCFRVMLIGVKLQMILQTDEIDRRLHDTATLTKGYGTH